MITLMIMFLLPLLVITIIMHYDDNNADDNNADDLETDAHH